MSYTKRVFSPIYLPFFKACLVLRNYFINTNLSYLLFAIVPEAILYTVSKRVRGLQFFKIFLVYYFSGYMLFCLVFELLKVLLCRIRNLLI